MTMKLLLKTAAVTLGLMGAFGSADAGEANGGRSVFSSLRKSPSFMMFEALFDEAICCTGVAWDFAGFSSRDREEFKPFFEAVRRAMPALREVSEAFGRTPCSGVSFPWDGHSGTVPGRT